MVKRGEGAIIIIMDCSALRPSRSFIAHSVSKAILLAFTRQLALADAVRAGKLVTAAMETFEYEPVWADSPLIAAAKEGYNVILTPYTAAVTCESNV